MSIIVEDGTKVVGAESYISVAEADTYHAKRGNTAWDALDNTDQKEPALRKATEYLDARYDWQGYQAAPLTQALAWPRYDVFNGERIIESDEIPQAIKRACAELALKSISEDLMPDLEQGVVSEQVGSISVTYDKNSPQAKRYKFIDAILAPYCKSGGFGASIRLVRT